jgi:hypothetical protein
LLSLFQKIKILQAMHNLSDSKIRDCIGKDRYYNIEKGKADLPLETAINFFELCKLSDTEKLWFIDKNASDYPMPQNLIKNIDKIAELIKNKPSECNTLDSEAKNRVQPKKPHPS